LSTYSSRRRGSFYDLERLWRESKRVALPAELTGDGPQFFEKRIVIELFARSSGMREAVSLAERVSSTDANVLITGESGTGKDVLASFIHWKSARAAQPLVKIDCATLPGELLEAELFGYERGAFTGATEGKPGRFEAAQQGTIVLDEIAHLSTDAQRSCCA
jgi:transcriptional regulator with PAS, ATPase and Fis domain